MENEPSNLEPTGLGAPLDFTGGFAFFGWESGPVPDAGQYIGFTLSTPLPVTYQTLTYGLMSDANVPQGPRNWELRASADGFTTSDILVHAFDMDGAGGREFTGLDISALGTLVGVIDFRLYGFNGSPDTFGGIIGFFDEPPFTQFPLTLTGTIASVPAPPTPSLMGIGALILGLVLARRRPRAARRSTA